MTKYQTPDPSGAQLSFDFLLMSAKTVESDFSQENDAGVTQSRLNVLNDRFSQLHQSAVEVIKSRDQGHRIDIPAHVTDYSEKMPPGFYYPERLREKFLAADAMQVDVDEVGGVYDSKGYSAGTAEANILVENNPFPSKESKDEFDSMYVDWGLNLKENKYFDLVNPKVVNNNTASGFSYFLNHEEYKTYVDCKFDHAEKMYAKSLAENINQGKSASDLPPIPEGVSVVAMAMSVKTMLASIVQVALNDYIRATSISEGPVPTTPKKHQLYLEAKKEASEIVAYFKDQIPGLEVPFSRVFHNLDIAEHVSLKDFVSLCVHEPEKVRKGIAEYLEALGANKTGRIQTIDAAGSAPDDLYNAAEREVEVALSENSDDDVDLANEYQSQRR